MSGLVDAFVEAIMQFWGKLVDGVQRFIGENVVDPFLDFVTYTPRPLHEGDVAIVNPPTNGVWPTIYDGYVHNLEIAYVVLFFAVITTNAAATIGVVSSYRQQRFEHNAVTAGLLLPLGWPFGALVLHSFHGLTQLVLHGTDLTGLLTTLVAVLATASSIPGVNVISTLFGVLDLGVMLVALVLYVFRILFLLTVMYLLPLLIAFKFTRIPVVSAVADRFIAYFLKLAMLPVFVAGGFWLSSALFDSAGQLALSGLAVSGVMQFVFAIVIPVMTIGLYYLTLQASMGRTANRMAYSAKRRYGGTTAADTERGQQLAEAMDTTIDRRMSEPIRNTPSALKRASRSAVGTAYKTRDTIRGVPAWRTRPTSDRQADVQFQQPFAGTDPRFPDPDENGPRAVPVDRSSAPDGAERHSTDGTARPAVLEPAVAEARKRETKRQRRALKERKRREARQRRLRERYGTADEDRTKPTSSSTNHDPTERPHDDN